DRAGYADDRTMATDRAGYADDGTMAVDRAGYADDAAVAGDRAGYADDRGFGSREGDPTTAGPGYQTGDVRDPAATRTGTAAGSGVAAGEAGPLLAGDESEGFRARWTDVQTAFVDAPRKSVEQADALVAELMQHLAKTFADERGRLESQWDRGEDIPT